MSRSGENQRPAHKQRKESKVQQPISCTKAWVDLQTVRKIGLPQMNSEFQKKDKGDTHGPSSVGTPTN
ncbi:hypothetical protein CBR_g29775 [Chara braunii]|uniref:Uncharacterized protein n=1 Tax=Chara braunii TaxID=69332 RepID=A0A388LBG0_CHABU|nr:hypothetical protein CBR_g29775 [Chara braunii]|eukprot:GBG79626.1 hypothetical protein CBR_g29775 [Chara braunii]